VQANTAIAVVILSPHFPERGLLLELPDLDAAPIEFAHDDPSDARLPFVSSAGEKRVSSVACEGRNQRARRKG
jgi:hypothetical protein